MGTDDKTGPCVRMRINMCNICLRSGDGGLLGGVLGTPFVSANESKLGVSKVI